MCGDKAAKHSYYGGQACVSWNWNWVSEKWIKIIQPISMKRLNNFVANWMIKH